MAKLYEKWLAFLQQKITKPWLWFIVIYFSSLILFAIVVGLLHLFIPS